MRTAVLPRSLQWPTHPRAFSLGGSRVRGLGGGLPTLPANVTTSQYGAAVQSEGGDTAGATAALSNAVDTLLPTLDPTAYSYSDIVSMAQTTWGRVLHGGAVEHVSQLLSAASGGIRSMASASSRARWWASSGQLGSLAAVAGATLPGIGTAIPRRRARRGARERPRGSLAAPVLRGGCSYTSSCQPTIVAGCTASCDAQQWPSGSPFWRHFPKKTGGNENDSQWYDGFELDSVVRLLVRTDGHVVGPPSAAGCPVSVQQTNVGYRARRRRLPHLALPRGQPAKSPSSTAGRSSRSRARRTPASSSDSAALAPSARPLPRPRMANKEFELNGMKSQPDWLVFPTSSGCGIERTTDSSVIDVPQLPKQPLAPPYVVRDSQHPISGGPIVGACPAYLSPFYQSLVTQAIGNGP